MAREKGIVKWFSTDKGYGFIRRETGDEIFVHHTDIEVDGYASLKNGETVEFDVFDSDRGPKARNLVPLEADGTPSARRAKTSDGGSRAESGAKAEAGSRGSRGSRGGRGDSGGRKRSDRAATGKASAPAANGRKTLAQQIRERLGRRFPGLGD